MEEILRGEKEFVLEDTVQMEQLFESSFNESGAYILFPVRHHSPACSYHIKKLIYSYQPDAVLVEGPENAAPLIPYIASEKTKAPFCIYLSFDDKEGLIGEKSEKYRAYYPFLEFSPELTAIREAKNLGAFCEFIDLSYGEKLINSPESRGEKETYHERDEKDFLLGTFYNRLTEKTSCQSFNEFWEKYFEIDGFYSDTRAFAKGLFAYCYYSRFYTEEAEREKNGDLAREQVMKEHVAAALEKYQKVLVITGGMHTIALAKYLKDGTDGYGKKIKRLKKESSPAYLMPYSYEESDQASGYEAGMAFPFFYQRVWENMQKRKKIPYENAALSFIIKTAGIIRKKQALSISDEMQSYYMARGLASLREKKECGVYELIDSVKASFVKSEIHSVSQPALKNLYRLLTGIEMGCVDEKAGVPPIVTDFLQQCKKFRIQTNTSLKKQTKLDIYNKAEHLEKSRFFRQMQFLDTGFCTYLKSQQDNGNTGRILLRESWEYRFAPAVQAALINVSAYGGTLRQASLSLISRKIKEEHHTAKSLSGLLLSAEQMGLDEVYEELSHILLAVIGEDMDFISVVECVENLNLIRGTAEERRDRGETQAETEEKTFLLTEEKTLENIISLSLNRSFTLFYTVIQVQTEEEEAVCQKIKYLYQYFIDKNSDLEELFLSCLESACQEEDSNSALSGVSAGVLVKKDRMKMEEVFPKFEACIKGTEASKKSAVSFLKGFFMTAKDIIFVDDMLLVLLDEILKETDGDLFLELLPELRLAFTYFLPFETDKIAKRVAELYGVSTGSIQYGQVLEQTEMEEAEEIDRFCMESRKEWFTQHEKGSR